MVSLPQLPLNQTLPWRRVPAPPEPSPSASSETEARKLAEAELGRWEERQNERGGPTVLEFAVTGGDRTSGEIRCQNGKPGVTGHRSPGENSAT